jgi:hypothetical protein
LSSSPFFYKKTLKIIQKKHKKKNKKKKKKTFFSFFFFFFCVDFLISLLPKIKFFWWCTFGKLEGIDEMKLMFKPKNKLKQVKHLSQQNSRTSYNSFL